MVPAEEAVSRENCWLEGSIPDKPVTNEDGDTIGYVIWGVQSCCYAFQVGRHDNVVVAKVTDGTLTIGVKNEGTNGGGAEWTGVGNARVIYLGEESSDKALAGLDKALASDRARSATLQEYEGSTGEDYKAKPFFSDADRQALAAADAADASTLEAKYGLLESYTAIFQSIYETKPAYTALMDAFLNVENKWAANNALQGDARDEMIDELYGILDDLQIGTFTAQGAYDRKDALYEKYPDYLAYDPEKSTCTTADVVENEPFLYEVTMKGESPYINVYTFYEDLTEDRTILSVQYKSEKDLEGGLIYYGKDNLSAARNHELPTLTATDELKTIYIDIAADRETYAWGNKDHYLRWALAESGNFTVTVGRVRVISEAQMQKEGGSLLNGISDVIASGKQGPKTGIYTLQGVRVEKAVKGLYIIDGRKVLVK
jgi:hypothetical protein